MNLAEKQIFLELISSERITYYQRFPQAQTIAQAQGILIYYIEAPFVALSSGRGLDSHLLAMVVAKTCQQVRANYEASHRIVNMAQWATEVVVGVRCIPRKKIFTILLWVNLDMPKNIRDAGAVSTT